MEKKEFFTIFNLRFKICLKINQFRYTNLAQKYAELIHLIFVIYL